MRLQEQRTVWNKLRDDQKFQLFVEMTDELEVAEQLHYDDEAEDMYWDASGDRFTTTKVCYGVSE